MNVLINNCLGRISVSPRLVQDELDSHRQFALYAGHRPDASSDIGHHKGINKKAKRYQEQDFKILTLISEIRTANLGSKK